MATKIAAVKAGSKSPAAWEAAAGAVPGVRSGRAAIVEGDDELVLLIEFDAERASDVDEIVARAQEAVMTKAPEAAPRVVMVRTGWLPWGRSGPNRKACQAKYRLMIKRQKAASADLMSFKDDLGEAAKDSFAYFGAHSRIMGPFEVSGPGRIHIGNWVSFSRYGRILMNTDFTRFKERCLQHYPEVKHDYDPKIFGAREPRLKVGDGTTVGDGVFINCTNSIEIGKHLIISSRVYIGDAHHNFENLQLPITLSANSMGRPVKIGDQCWIGVGAAIMEGVTIGRHSIIGANSVVTKNVPDYCVAAGVPARVIRTLDGSPIPAAA